MGQDARDHRRIDDGGDDVQLAATVRALFEVDGEDALEQPRPTQARRSVVRAGRLGRRDGLRTAPRLELRKSYQRCCEALSPRADGSRRRCVIFSIAVNPGSPTRVHSIAGSQTVHQ
jgi:hypothetical protein